MTGRAPSMSFLSCLYERVTVTRAAKVSAIVGTLLVVLNHADLLIAGELPAIWKIVATYCVPYCVSSYSTAALLSQLSRIHFPPHVEGAKA